MTAESMEARVARLEEIIRSGFQRLESLIGAERERIDTRCAGSREEHKDFEDRIVKLEEFRQEMLGFMSQVKGAWKATAIISGVAGSIAGIVITILVQVAIAVLKAKGLG